jgi:hypothetical protein
MGNGVMETVNGNCTHTKTNALLYNTFFDLIFAAACLVQQIF